MSKCIAIILAGGYGVRFGADIPKQFIEVEGKTILQYSIDAALGCSSVDSAVIVCAEPFVDRVTEIVAGCGWEKPVSLAPAGKEFIDSFRSGMMAIDGVSDDVVVVLSGDRPLIETWEIDDAVEKCQEHGSGIASQPAAICAVRSVDGVSSNDYLRKQLFFIVTPWAFRFEEMYRSLKAYDAGELEGAEPYPPAIFAAAGNELYLSGSSRYNIKITHKEDLAIMKSYLDERRERNA